MQKAFDEFAGSLLESEGAAAWALPAAERVRSKFLDLAERLARHEEARGDHAAARAVYLRAIDKYPTSARSMTTSVTAACSRRRAMRIRRQPFVRRWESSCNNLRADCRLGYASRRSV
jgi:hypothetical protein